MTGTVERLLTEHLDTWTAAVETKSAAGRGSGKKLKLVGIAKLRELILELAVRGQLVPQDECDEPASVLLERIAVERERLVKKPKALTAIVEDDIPFKIPNGWSWKRLGEVCILENGDRSKNYPNKSLLVDAGIPFVNAGHLQNSRVNKSDMTFITPERFEMLRAGKFSDGDILYCLRGSLGKSALVEGFEEGAIASSLVIVRLFSGLNNLYILDYFDAPLSLMMIRKYDNGTAQPNLSAADLGKFLVPIPPEAEQKRIVAKVDELMALCDALEHEQESSIAAHGLLVENLLAALTNAAGQGEFKKAWARMAAHFDTLFTTEKSVEQLKLTILQLAVMGKLVEQDPEDEPAAVLLERIAAEKARLVEEKMIKKQKALPEISEEEKVFELPEGWVWARLGEIGIGSTGKTPKTSNPDFFGPGIPFIGPGQITLKGELLNSDKFLTELGVNESSVADKGDIMMVCIGGSIGKVVIVDQKITFNQQINAMKPILISPKYLFLALSSQYFYNSVLSSATGSATPIINRLKWEGLLVVVPQVNQQTKIVAKVDELFALCDRLSVTVRKAQSTQLQVADTLAGLVSGKI